MDSHRPELTEDEKRQLEGGLGGYTPRTDKLPGEVVVEAQGIDHTDVDTPLEQDIVEEAVVLRQGLGG